MPEIASNWRIVHHTTTLVEYGDLLADELPFDLSTGTEVVPSPDSAYPLLLATGNNTYNFTLSVFRDYPSDRDAAADLFGDLLRVSSSFVSFMTLQRRDWTDRWWRFETARITRATPKIQIQPDTARLRLDYTITAAGLTYVGP